MRRRTRSRSLAVWVNGVRTGVWRIPSRGPTELQYDDAWIASPDARPLSISLPLTLDNVPLRGDAVEWWFDNLLPDSEAIRRRIRMRFGATSDQAFDLLAAVGRDCVGAVQLLPEEDEPDNVFGIDCRPLSHSEVEEHLIRTVNPPPPGRHPEDDFRISIAGAQEKTAFLLHEGRWCRPLGATPTTHIFKLPLGRVGNLGYDLSTSVENEWLCSEILSAFGLPVAESEIGRFGDQKVLIVKRFDRRLHASGGYWLRLPQEDFCQAAGLPATLKYEADGGPGMRRIAATLQGSNHRQDDIALLVKAQILFWMLAATDGHAKNFSIRILAGGRYEMTPLYDVLSVWPLMGKGASRIPYEKARLAMSLPGRRPHYHLQEIQRRHFNAAAVVCGHGDSAELLIEELLAATPSVIDTVGSALPADFPATVADPILKGLARSAERLAAMPRE